ncbi:MAG: cyclic nucleotide-binding domain-containing protein [Actinomycetota bacterium]|nr:cyclic nucleotide-binding domain-containing protein [Actinomycetota bacterium]
MRGHKDPKVDLLKEVPLFANCSDRGLATLASITDEVDLQEGKELTHEGDLGREFFVIVDGTADVRVGGEKVQTLGPGDFLGEIALVEHTPRTATVVATSPIQVLVIRDQEFRGLLEKHPDLDATIRETAAAREGSD